jgi:hypothetical protein
MGVQLALGVFKLTKLISQINIKNEVILIDISLIEKI